MNQPAPSVPIKSFNFDKNVLANIKYIKSE